MYCKICIIGFLSSLCSARISLNDASKKAYLICENSVKTGKTQVSQILQRYASDHPYQDKFPSHLREASDFFENKYMELISDFGIQLNQKKRKEKLQQAHTMGGAVLDIINNESNHSDGGNSNHDSRSVTSNPSLHSNPNSNRNGSEGGLPASVTHSIMKDITDCHGNLNAISMSIDQFNKLAAFLSGMISNQKTQQSTINDLVSRVTHLESQQQKILNDVQSNSPRSPTTYGNDATNGSQQPFNSNRSVISSNPSCTQQPPQQAQQRRFQMPNNPQPGGMQPGSNGNNNNNNNGSININAFQQRNNNQQSQPRFSQQQSPKTQNLPNQGRLSPANSHTTKTTTSTNSLPSAQFNNNPNVMQMNTNGIQMTVQNINKSMGNNRNGNNNMNMGNMNMNRMAMNNMNNMSNVNNINNMNMNGNMNINNMMNNNMNNMMNNNNGNNNNQLQVPQMNHMSNIANSFPVPQIQNMNMNQLNRMGQMQQQQQTNVNNVQTQQMNNMNNNMNNMNQFNNNNNNNQQLNVPSIPGAATPAANMGNLPQPSNTLNNGGLPTTSLYGVGSYDSNDGDANMYGFGNNQSFNSSDAGMTNMMSIPNNGVQQQNQQQVQQPVPLDAGYGMRFSDQSVNLQNALQSVVPM